MKSFWKKTVTMGVIALFLSLLFMPTISASQKKDKQTISSTLQNLKEKQLKPIQLKKFASFQDSIGSFISDIIKNKDSLKSMNDITGLIRGRWTNPIMMVILARIFGLAILRGQDFIVSIGSCYDLNPFKRSQVKLTKPLTFWRYRGRGFLGTTSQTLIISSEPFRVRLLSGNQLGLMTRFRGLYSHISNPLPSLSHTYMYGVARNIWATELP